MITVAIMSYRYGHLVAQAIESVLCQTLRPRRVLVVDDGVGDVEPVARAYPVDLLARPRNLGIVDNFNDVLLNHVQTPKVLFLGADNFLRPDTLERMVMAKADIVSSDIALFGTETAEFAALVGARESVWGYPIWRFRGGDINHGNYIHGSSLYNATMARRFGYKASGNAHSEEDWVLFRAMLNAGATHKHIPEPLLFYRRHKSNFIQLDPRERAAAAARMAGAPASRPAPGKAAATALHA
jgi:glycosyltransferase involved in cell wall biosynthesis